jgi:zinc protease
MSTIYARNGRWKTPKWHARAAPTPAPRAISTAIFDLSDGVEVAHGIGVGAALACYSGARRRPLRAGSLIAAVVGLVIFSVGLGTAAPAGPARRSEHSAGYKRVMGFPRKPVQLRVPRVGREVERRVLSNGIVLYLMEDRERPLVRMEAVVRGGTDYVPRDQEFAMGMLGSQMRQGGTKSRTFEQLNDELEFVGASVEARTGGEQSSVSLDVLTKDLDLGLKLFADVIMHPVFDAQQLEIAKGQAIEGIRRRNDQPGSILGRYFSRLLYTPEHPAGRSGFTTIAEVTAVNPERLAALHRQYFGPNNTWIAVVGDFDRAAITAKIEAAFAGWAPVDKAVIEREKAHLPRAAGKNVPGVFVIQRPLNQASIALGHFGVDWNNPDRFALNLMNYILGGGGFTSRIMERVRSDEGLAYAVSTQFPISDRDLGLFRATLQTKTESTGPAIQAILEEIERIRTEPVSAQELELAKEDFINSYIFRFDSSFSNVTQLMQLELDDRPRDYYETLLDKYRAVTREDLLRVAQKYLHPKDLTILVVGDTQQINAALAKFGRVTPINLETVE